MANSLRDSVKDAIIATLGDRPFMDVPEVAADIADAVFDAMGIPEYAQDAPLEVALSRIADFSCSGWTVEDIHLRRGELELPEWSKEEAENFLKPLLKHLEMLSTADGNALIDDELLADLEAA